MTERLFEQDPYIKNFSAEVLSCEPQGKYYSVTLNATAFFPEGGGQAGDTGTLGEARVLDTQIKDNIVYHLCDKALAVGKAAEGAIHWPQRFQRMQDHSGEHILSGLLHSRFGYDNIGFHMGTDCLTVDFSGKITMDELMQLQEQANEIITADVPIHCFYPDKKALASYNYRSKKEIDGPVRLVSVPGADVCACCGTHVARTGEIGLVLILSREGLGEGTRIRMLCGKRAENHVRQLMEQTRQIMGLLSVPDCGIAEGTARMVGEMENLKLRISRMIKADREQTAAFWAGKGNVLLFREELDGGAAGQLALAVAKASGGHCAVCVEAENGFRLALAGENARTFGKKLTELLDGRGGGRELLFQGSLRGDISQIEQAWKQVVQ